MKYQDALDRLMAAQQVFGDTTITHEKFVSVQKLLKGIHPNIDRALSAAAKEWDKLQKFEKGDVISLVASELPEVTEEEKKRKKRILFFLSFWKDLQKEVVRVKAEFEKSSGDKPSQTKAQGWGNILGAAKGPVGIITVVAIGWVLLSSTAVDIAVTNRGCESITPISAASIPLPGISFPKEPIVDGGVGIVRMPPLTLSVDGTRPGIIGLSALKFNYQFNLSFGVSLQFDGQSLNGSRNEIRLKDKKRHELIVQC